MKLFIAILFSVPALAVIAVGCASTGLPYPDADYPARGAQAAVRTIEVGAAPQLLSYQSTPGATAKQRVSIELSVVSDPAEIGSASATMTMDTTATATEGAAGAIVVETVVDAIEGDGAGVLEGLSGALGGLRGATERSMMDAQGQALSEPQVDEAGRALRDVLNDTAMLAPILPTTPIGVGARWDVLSTRAAQDGNLLLRANSSFTLTAMTGTTATLEVRELALALDAATSEGDVLMQLDRVEIRTEGTITIDLVRPIARTGKLKSTITVTGDAVSDGMSVDFETVTTVHVSSAML